MRVRSRALARMMEHGDLVLALLLLLLWLYEALVVLGCGELLFTAQGERELFHVLDLARHGSLPPEGILGEATSLDLGPLYFFVLAPLNRIWPSPYAVHVLGTLASVAGAVAAYAFLRRAAGRAAALLGLLLYSQSAAHVALALEACHAVAIPGVALGLMAAMAAWAYGGSRRALVLAGVLLAVLVQLHDVGFLYVPAAVALLVAGRHGLCRRSVWVAVAATALALSPLLFHALSSIFCSRAGGGGPPEGLAPGPGVLVRGLLELTRPHYLLSARWGGVLVLLLGGIGTAGTFVRMRSPDTGDGPARWFRPILVGQLALGCVIAAVLVPSGAAGTYLAVSLPLFVLAAFGVADLDAVLRWRGRPPLGRALTFGAVVAGLAIVEPPARDVLGPASGDAASAAAGPRDYLTLREQQAAVSFLAGERGLSFEQMWGRVHGVFFGEHSGVRYLEHVLPGPRRDAPDDDGDHWLVLPAGFPGPDLAGAASAHTRIDAGPYALNLVRFRPRFDPDAILGEGGAPCPRSLPYVAGHRTRSRTPAAEDDACWEDGRTIVVPLPPETLELTLQLCDDGSLDPGDDPAARPPASLRVEAEGAPALRLALVPATSGGVLWFHIGIPPHDGARTLHLTLHPRGRLRFLDLW